MPAIAKTKQLPETKKGFTLIEVMLVLGLTGLLIVGMLGGTFTAIAHQRYNDSVRSFAEYLRTVYGAVLSPESLGAGNSMSEAVFGKILVFGYNYPDSPDNTRSVYSATLIGKADIPNSIDGDFMDELASVEAHLYCGDAGSSSTQDYYLPLWEASLAKANNTHSSEPFAGTVLIARSPTSGTVHTYFSEKLTYDLRDGCTSENQTASGIFQTDIQDRRADYRQEAVGFCIKSENAAVYREVRLAEDGRNTSAINILDTDSDIPGEGESMSLKTRNLLSKAKRGDTFIEVMFAIAIFSLVAVISIAMMNAGVADAERALELVTARNELNAQAEALRFIHSSYISEATLPPCGSVASGEKCQQYQALWEKITKHALRPSDEVTGLNDNYTITDLYTTCREIHTSDDPTTAYQDLLTRNNAFIINTRELIAPRDTGVSLSEAYISTLNSSDRNLFTPALLNARIIFTRTGNRDNADTDSSTVNMSDTNSLDYKSVARAEGIWVVAVRSSETGADGKPTFYDFHINSCWYGSNSNVPTALDAVIRLYNPESIR